MDSGSAMLWIACALGAGAVALLRFAWSRPRRSAPWNGAGWAALLGSVVVAWSSDGAWGTAIAALVTMAAAFAALGVAGLTAPPGRAQASNRRVGMLPAKGEPRRVGRRVGTFLLVIVGGLAASVGLAVAVRGLGGALGWNEANTLVLALFIVPIAWAVLATVLLMQASRRHQVFTLLVWSLPVIPALVAGVA